jgi:hypothetical protein
MRRPALAASAFSILFAIAACETQDVSAPGQEKVITSLRLTNNASLDCRFAPSGSVEILVGQAQQFLRSAGNCAGAYGTLSPADGRVGFWATTNPCTTFATQESGSGGFEKFRIRRCFSGAATFRIYTNSSQTTLLQTINLVIN